ncbi:putative exonuclease GOR isoform X2 [Arctopsyche grandis]|uniref:putative exonuclease GOR isoform X2 n=1 Tax=Arctopsyche grandis TaxID=121162 RepID=UPI00406D83DB
MESGLGERLPPHLPTELVLIALVGLVVYFLVLLLNSLRHHAASTTPTPNDKSNETVKEKTPIIPPVTKQSKKKPHSAPHWKSVKNNFNHPFLATNLMGHTGKILGMDCSSDGKYLVTCAEDEPQADLGETSSSSSSEGGKENRSPTDSPTGSSPGSPTVPRRATRRRRKPRSAREPRMQASNSPVPQMPSPGPLHRYAELRLMEHDLANLLSRYLLTDEQLANLGYPVESASHPTCALIYAIEFTPAITKFDVNAREFVPGCVGGKRWYREDDSGRGSGSSSPRSGDSDPDSEEDKLSSSVQRRCARCTRGFWLSANGEYLTRERCRHHWGRMRRTMSTATSPLAPIWSWACCGGSANSAGCTRAPLHVWSGTCAGINGPLNGFVRTRYRAPGAPRRRILALDCEMCYTAAGLQVAQLEVVGADGRRVYSTYVQPDSPIIDYNTRFSGISARHLQKNTKSLKEVQNDLLCLIDAETILVGHGLENDLRALRILHGRVVDTAVSFPDSRGLPYRRSLRALVQQHLEYDVQQAQHCPLEDARVSLDLMLWRVQRDFLSRPVFA